MAITPNTDFSAGAIYTAQQANNFPRGVMGRAIATSAMLFTSATPTDFAGLSATFTAVANRYYKVSFSIGAMTGTAANRLVIEIREGSTILSQFYIEVTALGRPISGYYTGTFTAGSHTLKLVGYRDTGANNISCFGASDGPQQFTIEDIGTA
jgi:hypothetical protein